MIYKCLIKSLNEAIAYEKGDKKMGNSEKVAMLPVTEKELKHLINDTIAYIWKLEDTNQAIPERGYDSRKELLQKLQQFDKENFPEMGCAWVEEGITMIELKDFCGKHFLQGVERGHTDDAETFMFRLDGVTYVAEEDPEDGYRSMMKSLEIVEAIPRYALNVEVLCSMDSNTDHDVLEMRDVRNGKIILRVGTNYHYDYYPYFVAEWTPSNIACNLEE